MNEAEITAIIGKEKVDELQKQMIQKFIEGDKSFVSCECGNVIEMLQGEVPLNYKKEDGKELTKAAAVHMSNNRIRCNECNINFCVSCRTKPYHIGMTCKQHEPKVAAKKGKKKNGGKSERKMKKAAESRKVVESKPPPPAKSKKRDKKEEEKKTMAAETAALVNME